MADPRHAYTVTIEADEDGGYVATAPALHHVASHGETVENALANVKEAMELYIETLRELGDSVPPPPN